MRARRDEVGLAPPVLLLGSVGRRPKPADTHRWAASHRPIREMAEAGHQSVDRLVVAAHLDELRNAFGERTCAEFTVGRAPAGAR